MTKPNPHRNRMAGVTLLEVMIVLAVIALIVGFGAPRLMESFGRAKSQAAEVAMANLKGAVQLFYIDTGRYPSSDEGLDALLAAPADVAGWRGPYLDGTADLTDPRVREELAASLEGKGAFRRFQDALNRHEAFNDQNEGARLSWEDIFESRMFGSFITKEGNVLDQRIQDYKKDPLAALVEADKIHSEIFNFEHDLWNY